MARNKEKKVIIGGTFEVLHRGHKALLRRAFKLGQVTIGLTSNVFAKKLKKRRVKDFRQRKRILAGFIRKEFKTLPRIMKIEDKFGPTLERDFDYIVVSPKTYKNALLINRKRKKANKKRIKIIKIKLVLGRDGKPISSSKILK
jgi:pantetheine-phosphate adenylyltransferase